MRRLVVLAFLRDDGKVAPVHRTVEPSVRGVLYEDTRVPGVGLTRADMEEWTPAILVESPVVGDVVRIPLVLQ